MRHASHGLLPHTLAGRAPGVGLSPAGALEAERVARLLAREAPVAAVLSSPVQRATETAAAVGAALGRAWEVDAGFEEIDFGSWTGARFAALADDPAWRAWNALRPYARAPGGESMAEAQARALAALERCRSRFAGQAAVVVSHADIIKAVLAPALGLGLDRLHRLSVDPASVSTLVLFDEDVRVERVNMGS